MDFFKVGKYQSPNENVLYCAKGLYELLDRQMHIDELFSKFAQTRRIELSTNVERFLYLGLTLLFAFAKVSFNDNYLARDTE